MPWWWLWEKRSHSILQMKGVVHRASSTKTLQDHAPSLPPNQGSCPGSALANGNEAIDAPWWCDFVVDGDSEFLLSVQQWTQMNEVVLLKLNEHHCLPHHVHSHVPVGKSSRQIGDRTDLPFLLLPVSTYCSQFLWGLLECVWRIYRNFICRISRLKWPCRWEDISPF